MTDFSFLGEQPFNSIHTKQTYICEIVKMSFPFSEKQGFQSKKVLITFSCFSFRCKNISAQKHPLEFKSIYYITQMLRIAINFHHSKTHLILNGTIL